MTIETARSSRTVISLPPGLVDLVEQRPAPVQPVERDFRPRVCRRAKLETDSRA